MNGDTPLHKAAMYGCKDVVQILVERGADPNKINNVGYTPLHEATIEGQKTGAAHPC